MKFTYKYLEDEWVKGYWNFVQNNKSRLEYQLYDVKSKGFVFQGYLSSQSIGSGITAKELKNMRNQILTQILLHGSE